MGDLIKLNSGAKKFNIKNISSNKAEILIYDEIGQDYWGEGVGAKNFTEELNKIPDSVNLIEVRINSPGGSVFEGYTIYNRLKQHKAEVHVYIDGMAASIASVIALAGDKVFMAEASQMMIHKPMVGVFGNSDELLKMVDMLDTIENQILKVYRDKTNIDFIELQQMVSTDYYMTAEQAIDLGFVDEVIAIDDSMQFAANALVKEYSKDKRFFKASQPKINSNDDKIKQTINNFKNEIEEFLARS